MHDSQPIPPARPAGSRRRRLWELDQRYALTLRAAQSLNTTAALAQWWDECREQADWAGAFWAALTHACCDAELENRILGEVHMLQHQAGMCDRRGELSVETLLHENAVIARELGHAQRRNQQQAREHARKIEGLQAQLLRQRAETILEHTRWAQCRDDLERLRQLQPDLPEATRTPAQTPAPSTTGPPAACVLDGRSVLCVGGRTSSVPIYREVIEDRGARFLHHDGGQQDTVVQLDATLAAADLVICQSGCISHNAYWRVKDYCKRTGKHCVFVEAPSRNALERALERAVADAKDDARD